MSDSYTDSEIVNGIRNRDHKVLSFIYQQYLPMIQVFSRKNTGTDDEASDLFQEALIVIFEKINSDDFTLSSSFKTYLYAICRNKWLMILRKRRTGPQIVRDTEGMIENLPDTKRDWQKHEQFEIYRKHFKQLSKDCQKVLNMFLKGHMLKEIASEMGFTEMYAKKRKFLCQK